MRNQPFKEKTVSTKSPKPDPYTRVTDRIVASLEQGVRPWQKPWSAAPDRRYPALPVRHNGTPYRGINVLLLWGDAVDKGFTCNRWMTFRQAQECGAHVRKGEHGSTVVYADRATRTEINGSGEEIEHAFGFLKAYTVFNVEQIEGLPASVQPEPVPVTPGSGTRLIKSAEAFFAATGAVFQHGGDRAFYAPGPDCIQLPHPHAFADAESYAATKAHELIHWSGHESRLAREFGKRFGDTAYAREELVAELGAAFLCAGLGLSLEPRDDHAAYLSDWLAVLKEDKRAIFAAAAHAQRAAEFLHSLQAERSQPATA